MLTGFDEGGDWAEHHVILVLATGLGKQPDEISLDDRLADLAVDSLEIVEFVMRLEDELGLAVPDDNTEKLVTVRDLVEFVRRAKGLGG